jgi:hypothetical protein
MFYFEPQRKQRKHRKVVFILSFGCPGPEGCQKIKYGIMGIDLVNIVSSMWPS